jgi:hypothetical protein
VCRPGPTASSLGPRRSRSVPVRSCTWILNNVAAVQRAAAYSTVTRAWSLRTAYLVLHSQSINISQPGRALMIPEASCQTAPFGPWIRPSTPRRPPSVAPLAPICGPAYPGTSAATELVPRPQVPRGIPRFRSTAAGDGAPTPSPLALAPPVAQRSEMALRTRMPAPSGTAVSYYYIPLPSSRSCTVRLAFAAAAASAVLLDALLLQLRSTV